MFSPLAVPMEGWIAIGVGVAVLFLLICCCCLRCWCAKRRHKAKEKKEKAGQKGKFGFVDMGKMGLLGKSMPEKVDSSR